MLLMLVMAVSLVGCGDDDKSNKNSNNGNVADLFNPTTSDTAVNGTESNTGDPVTPYEPGASGPTNSQVETPTPEPEKNVITLMSADGKKIIHEFDIPDGYTVVSDKKSNHVELAKDGDDTIKVEIISGPCAEYLSTLYSKINFETANKNHYAYQFVNTYSNENDRNIAINKIIDRTVIDEKYFNQTFSNMRIPYNSDKYGYGIAVQYPEQHSLEPYRTELLPEDDWGWSLHWDFSNHKDSNTYPMTYYCYYYSYNVYDEPTPANETFTIKVTTTFNEDKYNELNPYSIDDPIEDKIYEYAGLGTGGSESLNKFLETNFNMNTHKCDHCK